mmetsp:Transcript_78195/g.156461  ORF Transcript_78195/g.156461 Transcript_78195/m.156461 type:complete len:261 (+) Transcript_78195:145-927(+)
MSFKHAHGAGFRFKQVCEHRADGFCCSGGDAHPYLALVPRRNLQHSLEKGHRVQRHLGRHLSGHVHHANQHVQQARHVWLRDGRDVVGVEEVGHHRRTHARPFRRANPQQKTAARVVRRVFKAVARGVQNLVGFVALALGKRLLGAVLRQLRELLHAQRFRLHRNSLRAVSFRAVRVHHLNERAEREVLSHPFLQQHTVVVRVGLLADPGFEFAVVSREPVAHHLSLAKNVLQGQVGVHPARGLETKLSEKSEAFRWGRH